AVRELVVGIQDVQRLVDAEEQREADERVVGEGGRSAAPVVEGGAARPAEQRPLRLDVEPPGVRDAEEGAQRGARQAAALLGMGAPGRRRRPGLGGAGSRSCHASMYPHPDRDVHIWTYGAASLTRLVGR